MANKRPKAETNKSDFRDPEDNMVQQAVTEITKLWTEHNAAEENAARIKVAIGDYIFDKFFGRDQSKLYDDKDKYNPKKVNSYASLLEDGDFQKLDIAPQTLRTMVYCAVTVKSLKSEGVDIMQLIEDKATVWTYTHLKFLARLERDLASQLALVTQVNEEKLTSRQLDEKVSGLLPKKGGQKDDPEEYDQIMLKVPTWMTPVMQFQKDITRFLSYNPTDENEDSENYVDKTQREKIHTAIKDAITNFNTAIKSLRALEAKLLLKENGSQSGTDKAA